MILNGVMGKREWVERERERGESKIKAAMLERVLNGKRVSRDSVSTFSFTVHLI